MFPEGLQFIGKHPLSKQTAAAIQLSPHGFVIKLRFQTLHHRGQTLLSWLWMPSLEAKREKRKQNHAGVIAGSLSVLRQPQMGTYTLQKHRLFWILGLRKLPSMSKPKTCISLCLNPSAAPLTRALPHFNSAVPTFPTTAPPGSFGSYRERPFFKSSLWHRITQAIEALFSCVFQTSRAWCRMPQKQSKLHLMAASPHPTGQHGPAASCLSVFTGHDNTAQKKQQQISAVAVVSLPDAHSLLLISISKLGCGNHITLPGFPNQHQLDL